MEATDSAGSGRCVTVGDRAGHCFDMAASRIVDNANRGHQLFACSIKRQPPHLLAKALLKALISESRTEMSR